MKLKNKEWYLVASVWVVGLVAWFTMLTGMGFAG